MEGGKRALLETLRQFFSTAHLIAFSEPLNRRSKQIAYVKRFERQLATKGWKEVPKMVTYLEKNLKDTAMVPEFAGSLPWIR